MQQHLGFGTFIFFGAFSFLGALFVLFFVPETKGLTLEEMDGVFGSSKGLAAEELERQAAINHRLGLNNYEDGKGKIHVDAGERHSGSKEA